MDPWERSVTYNGESGAGYMVRTLRALLFPAPFTMLAEGNVRETAKERANANCGLISSSSVGALLLPHGRVIIPHRDIKDCIGLHGCPMQNSGL